MKGKKKADPGQGSASAKKIRTADDQNLSPAEQTVNGDRIVKVANRTGNFSIILNECFRREDLSARAKGIFAFIMTLPPTWQIHKIELYRHFTEGRDALDRAFQELIDAGYIVKNQGRTCGKFTDVEYCVFESTQMVEELQAEKEPRKSPLPGKPLPVKPLPGFPQLLNTKTAKAKTQKKIKEAEASPPSMTDVQEFVEREKLAINADAFYHWYASRNWAGIRSWKAAARCWAAREKKKVSQKTQDARDRLRDRIPMDF